VERRVFARARQILLDVFEVAPDGAVAAVFREDDAPADAERIAEFPLPEPQRRRVGERMNIQNSRIFGTTTSRVSIALCHGTVVRLLDE
jgi:hypothetical protein